MGGDVFVVVPFGTCDDDDDASMTPGDRDATSRETARGTRARGRRARRRSREAFAG